MCKKLAAALQSKSFLCGNMADHKPQASHQSARSICTVSTENSDNKTIRHHLKLQVDLENFYPLETEDQSPRRFFDDVSALESQVSLF